MKNPLFKVGGDFDFEFMDISPTAQYDYDSTRFKCDSPKGKAFATHGTPNIVILSAARKQMKSIQE